MSLGMMVTRLAWMAQELGVLEQADNVGLAGILQGHHGGALEAQVSLEVLGDLADKTLEQQLADQELSGLLLPGNKASLRRIRINSVSYTTYRGAQTLTSPPDLTEGHGARPVAVGFLDAAGGRGGGVKRISGLIYEETRAVLKVFFKDVIRDAVTYTYV